MNPSTANNESRKPSLDRELIYQFPLTSCNLLLLFLTSHIGIAAAWRDLKRHKSRDCCRVRIGCCFEKRMVAHRVLQLQFLHGIQLPHSAHSNYCLAAKVNDQCMKINAYQSRDMNAITHKKFKEVFLPALFRSPFEIDAKSSKSDIW
jgi:hypothetical protein